MTIDVSKITYGSVIGPGDGVTISKATYGVLVGPNAGIAASKITYGVIVDTLTPEGSASSRRRQACVVN
ncbi:hypothetical protein SPHV1_230003 [Novosphingobium sp. KN65.2]|nr:hypothetical protein SPHV1_230003 [Novosphingobium sp. KN65.2]